MSLIVVPDACVLISAPLRDTILRACKENICKLRFTDEIMDEVQRNLIAKLFVSEDKAQRLVETIKANFDYCFVAPHKRLINSMPINKKDKHVLAAAVCSKAHIIVTRNLKDFPPGILARYEVEAQSPDEFLVSIFHSNRDIMNRILISQAAALKNPPLTISELLDRLRTHVPMFAGLVSEELAQQGDGLWLKVIEAESDIQ